VGRSQSTATASIFLLAFYRGSPMHRSYRRLRLDEVIPLQLRTGVVRAELRASASGPIFCSRALILPASEHSSASIVIPGREVVHSHDPPCAGWQSEAGGDEEGSGSGVHSHTPRVANQDVGLMHPVAGVGGYLCGSVVKAVIASCAETWMKARAAHNMLVEGRVSTWWLYVSRRFPTQLTR
jgi:hypothetical protein